MATKKTKDQSLTVRVSPETRAKFLNQSSRFGGTSYVLRELVEAFIESRIQIEAPKNPLFTLKG